LKLRNPGDAGCALKEAARPHENKAFFIAGSIKMSAGAKSEDFDTDNDHAGKEGGNCSDDDDDDFEEKHDGNSPELNARCPHDSFITHSHLALGPSNRAKRFFFVSNLLIGGI
jgi:hypothetical protein